VSVTSCHPALAHPPRSSGSSSGGPVPPPRIRDENDWGKGMGAPSLPSGGAPGGPNPTGPVSGDRCGRLILRGHAREPTSRAASRVVSDQTGRESKHRGGLGLAFQSPQGWGRTKPATGSHPPWADPLPSEPYEGRRRPSAWPSGPCCLPKPTTIVSSTGATTAPTTTPTDPLAHASSGWLFLCRSRRSGSPGLTQMDCSIGFCIRQRWTLAGGRGGGRPTKKNSPYHNGCMCVQRE
jgi:hypothetical protein